MGKKVLLVDDNPQLVASLFTYFESRSYQLDTVQDVAAGLRLAGEEHYDGIILDWSPARPDGLDFIRQLRHRGSTVPVIMLTARDALADKLSAFRSGVDDYLTKPFAVAELEVRLEALMLRGRGRQKLLAVEDLVFDPGTQMATRNGIALQLYPAGKRLLETLLRASPEIVERRQLESLLWGDDLPDRDMLRSHMYELRRAVDGPFADKLIHTIPKRGYRITAARQTP